MIVSGKTLLMEYRRCPAFGDGKFQMMYQHAQLVIDTMMENPSCTVAALKKMMDKRAGSPVTEDYVLRVIGILPDDQIILKWRKTPKSGRDIIYVVRESGTERSLSEYAESSLSDHIRAHRQERAMTTTTPFDLPSVPLPRARRVPNIRGQTSIDDFLTGGSIKELINKRKGRDDMLGSGSKT